MGRDLELQFIDRLVLEQAPVVPQQPVPEVEVCDREAANLGLPVARGGRPPEDGAVVRLHRVGRAAELEPEPPALLVAVAHVVGDGLAHGERVLPADVQQAHEDGQPAFVQRHDARVALFGVAVVVDFGHVERGAGDVAFHLIFPPLMALRKGALPEQAVVEEKGARGLVAGMVVQNDFWLL